jgi:hypothetical protein
MRELAKIAVLIVAGLGALDAAAQRNRGREPAERCESTSCFNQTRIRDAEVIDSTTLIVFVGRQDCPFLVEMDGVSCDLTFLPSYDIVFRPNLSTRQRSVFITGSGRDDKNAVEQPRVCANDLNLGLQYDEFTNAGGGANNDGSDLSCRLRNVRSLTDDERLQIYVDRQMAAPPPPFGAGQVSAPAQPENEPDASE